MNKKNNKNKKVKVGFTMVELMVAITISLVMTGVIAVSVNKYFAKEKLDKASAEVSSLINSARNMAITNQAPSGFKMDYVAVTLTSAGVIEAFPVNSGTGIGASYFSKDVADSGVTANAINFGDLLFAAGSGKLLGKNASPSYTTYPLPPTSDITILLSSAEVDDRDWVKINHFGTAENGTDTNNTHPTPTTTITPVPTSRFNIQPPAGTY